MLNRKGYTLVEVLAVVALIGILLGGVGLVVTKVIQKQKENIKQDTIKNIEDAAITYVLNKKYYVQNCQTFSGNTMVTITADQVAQVNELINTSYSTKRGNFKSLNDDTALKEKLIGKNGTSGIFGALKDNKCYKLISVETLINEGFIEKANDCNIDSNKKYSVVVVYSMGDNSDKTAAGQLTAVSDKNICI